MANRRKTLEQLEASGTLGKNRKRYEGVVAAARGFLPLGDPPGQLAPEEADAWRDLSARATPGTLAQSDYVMMVLASRLTAKLLWKFDDMTDKDKSILQSVMKDLGMAPITRGRVTPVKVEPESTLDRERTPLEKFMGMSDEECAEHDRLERRRKLVDIGTRNGGKAVA